MLSAIEAVETKMEPQLKALWSCIRIRPTKWSLPPWGNEGGGFWVVAVIGQHCIWYNDIEEGFNLSRFDSFGQIGEYLCNQDDLMQCLLWHLRPLFAAPQS